MKARERREAGTGEAVPRRAFGHAEAYAAICALSFFAAWLVPIFGFRYACPFKALTGVPCATCGMTRAFVRLAHAEPAAALAASPFGALVAGAAWLFAVMVAVRFALALPSPGLRPGTVRALTIGGALALLANWAFLVVAHRP